MQPHTQHCKNCGSLLTDKYCSHCGEKIYTDKDKSIGHIIGEGFHFITHVEGTYLLTLKTIFRNPGKYSFDFCAGIRKKYFKPVSFFLIGVVIYLLFPFFQGLNVSFSSAVDTFNFLNTKEIVTEKAQAENMSMAELAHSYQEKSGKIAKLLLLILLPMKALVLYALFGRNRKRFFDHFIMATEITSFYLYFTFIFLPVFLWIIFYVAKFFGADASIMFSDPITMPIYLMAMTWAGIKGFKRFYDVPLMISFPKTLLFLLFHGIIVFIIYRIILFFLVLLFI